MVIGQDHSLKQAFVSESLKMKMKMHVRHIFFQIMDLIAHMSHRRSLDVDVTLSTRLAEEGLK